MSSWNKVPMVWFYTHRKHNWWGSVSLSYAEIWMFADFFVCFRGFFFLPLLFLNYAFDFDTQSLWMDKYDFSYMIAVCGVPGYNFYFNFISVWFINGWTRKNNNSVSYKLIAASNSNGFGGKSFRSLISFIHVVLRSQAVK